MARVRPPRAEGPSRGRHDPGRALLPQRQESHPGPDRDPLLLIVDDRLEIDNPGLLPFGLTVEDLRQDAGLPPPIVEAIATRLRVTIPTVPVGSTVVDVRGWLPVE